MKAVKVILCILLAAGVGFGGLIAAASVALTGGAKFYQWLAFIIALLLLFIALCWIWKWFSVKTRVIANAAPIAAILLCVAVFEIGAAYHDRIDTVGDQGVDLTLYEPFRENTKAVSLDKASTLRFESGLPRLDGATALYPLYSAFARAAYPEGDYPAYVQKEEDYVVCANTAGAYRRLIDGEADVIFVAAPSEEQRQMAADNGLELVLTPIGREAFVFFVNSKNPVDGLTTEEIKKIYSGEITNWRSVGGKNRAVRAFQRPEGSGSQTMLIRIMEDTALMVPPKRDVPAAMGGIIHEVSAYKNYDNAVGYSFLYFATEMVDSRKIKLLAINGTAPTREAVASGAYPYAAEFYAVTAGEPEGNTKQLIDWILSPQGQTLVEKTGYTPY